MIDRKEIDLLVRAQLKGKGDLTSVTKSIGELEKAIESQSAAAKRGESSIDELKSTLLSLQQVQDRLKSQADLVGTFQRQGDAVAKLTERVERSGKAYQTYREKLDGLAEVTGKQQDRLVKLSTAYERAQGTLEKQKASYAALTNSLREAGIATDQLADAELRIRTSAAQIGVSIAKTQGAIATYADDVKKARQAIREKEQAERDAIVTSEQFAAAERRAAEASRKRAQDAADVARIEADRTARGAADSNQFAFDAQAAARARELAALKSDIIARSEEQLRVEKELAKNSALKKTADDAQDAARAYSSLAKASGDLSPKTKSLRDAIADITEPAAAARKSLNGIESEVADLAKAIGQINGPVRDYRVQMRALVDANRAISSQASLVDDFRRQAEALRSARAEFSAARAKVNEYAAAVRQGGEAGAQFTASLADASAKARTAAQALNAQLNATRSSRDALRAAGIETNNLAGAQQRLTSAAKSTVKSTEDLSAAMRRYGNEVDGTTKRLGLFGQGGRTTLSLLQRIRGEVLSLVAAYAGLQGAISLGGDSLDAFSTRQGIKNQLSLSVGNDRAAIDEEYEYVKAQSDRIGIEFETAAKGYTKFAAAAAIAGRSRKEIRYIWESFAEVGRVANLSADNLDGVFKALEQITSKGTIQAEELRGQLGDRLFGAFEVAAQSLADQFPNLEKAMKGGEVGAEQLVRIAERYRQIVAEQLPEAQQSLAAGQMRLNNAVYDFKLALADSGWADTYREMLPKLTEFLRSDDGKQFAKSLSEAFSALADGLVWLLQNLDLVKTAAKVIAGYFAIMIGNSVVRTTIAFAGNIKALGLALVGVGKTVVAFGAKWPILAGIVKGAFGIMGAAMLGWQVGTWASEEFEVVRKAGIALVTGLDIVWTQIRYGAQILWEEIPRMAKNAFSELINAVSFGLRGTLLLMQKGMAAIGRDDLASNIGRVVDNLTLKYEQQGTRVGQLKDQMARDIEAIRQIGDSMWKDAERTGGIPTSPTTQVPKASIAATAFPGVTAGKSKSGPSEKDIASRASQIEQITRALETLEAKIDRAQTDTLAKQLEAVDVQYAALARRIGKLGGTAGAEFLTRLNEATAQLKVQITSKFNDDLLAEQEALQNKIEGVEAAAGKKSKFELDKRLAAIRTAYEDTYRDIAEMRTKLEANNLDTGPADLARARLDAGIAELQNLERIKFATEELNRLEAHTNDLIALRDKLLASVLAQKQAGAITDVQAAQQINQINQEAIPGIQAAALATREWAVAHATIFANPEQLEVFIAQLDALSVKAGAAKQEFTDFQTLVGKEGSEVITGGLDAIFSGLEDIATGQKSVSEGFKDIGRSTLGIFAQFFKDIALAILKIMLFNALKNSGNPYLAAVGQIGGASVGVKHAGGIVGAASNRNRTIGAEWFANAPRYHGGGIPGLAPDEYATILKKNEEVLTEDSPRNILNGGATAGRAESKPQDVSIANYVDAQSFLSAGTATPAGRKIIMNVLSAERSTLRTLVGG